LSLIIKNFFSLRVFLSSRVQKKEPTALKRNSLFLDLRLNAQIDEEPSNSTSLLLSPLLLASNPEKLDRMSSLSILRFFLGPQSPEHKSKKFSSSESDREKIRIIYNKTVYDRDVVIILLIKIRRNLDISLFDRISFKNVAMTKILYACLSNIKKVQYKAQIEQVIRDFLDIKDVFNR
jgi:hypothetical protein